MAEELESVALARRFAAAINAAAMPDDLLAPDFELVNAATAVTDKVYYGREGAERWRRDLFEAFGEGARFEYEIAKATEEYVIARLRAVGEGSASGAPLDMRWAAVMWQRDGRLTKAEGFLTRREAFAAVGLEPEPR